MAEQAGRAPSFAALDDAFSAPDYDDIPWDCLDALVRGAPLLKWGRQGDPHFRDFQVSIDCTSLCWISERGATRQQARINLKGCRLIEGQSTEVFLRQPRADLADVSFSLVYEEGRERSRRTLDVACKDRQEYETWVVGLSYLVNQMPPEALLEARKGSLWSDVVPLFASRSLQGNNIRTRLKNKLQETNDVVAMGKSNWGQLGTGDEQTRVEPTVLTSFLGRAVKSVAVGAAHCIALTTTGTAWVWGHGGCGRLGTGGTDHELAPRMLLIPGSREPFKFRSVACGDMHTLAVGAEGGAVYAWGAGHAGQLGTGAREDKLVPTLVPAFLAGVYPSGLSSTRVVTRGSVAEWASPGAIAAAQSALQHRIGVAENSSGAPPQAQAQGGGIDVDSTPTRPRRASMMSPSGNVLGSTGVSLGVTSGGTLYVPIAPTGLHAMVPAIVTVGAGTGYSAFVDTHGRLYTCGIQDGPLGHDVILVSKLLAQSTAALLEASTPSSLPVGPQFNNGKGAASGAVKMPAGDAVARAVSAVQNFVGGGATTAATDLLSPVQVLAGLDAGREQVMAVACGELHALLVTSTGLAYSWGWGQTGALGHGDSLDKQLPTRIQSLPIPVLAVAAGAAHSLALVDNGASQCREVYGFGSNMYGQVSGADHVGQRAGSALIQSPRLLRMPLPPPTPKSVPSQSNVQGASGSVTEQYEYVHPSSISAGAWHSGVLLSDKTLLLFGCGRDGELGLNEAQAFASAKTAADWERDGRARFGVKQLKAVGTFSKLVDAIVPSGLTSKASLAKMSMAAAYSSQSSGTEGGTTTAPPGSSRPPTAPSSMGAASRGVSQPPRPVGRVRTASVDSTSSSTQAVEVIVPATPAAATPGGRHTTALSPAPTSDLDGLADLLVASGLAGLGGPATASAKPVPPPAQPVAPTATATQLMQPQLADPNDMRPRFMSMAHRYFQHPGHGGGVHGGGEGGRAGDGGEWGDDDDDWLTTPGVAAQAALQSSGSGAGGLHVKTGSSGSSGVEAGFAASSSTAMDDSLDLNAAAPLSLPFMGESASSTSAGGKDVKEARPLGSTIAHGPLPVLALVRRGVRTVACGNGFTIVTVPTQWIRNEEAPSCMRCGAGFGTVTRRRHHCRQCGGVVCAACSERKLPLLQLGYIAPVRVCDGCWTKKVSEA